MKENEFVLPDSAGMLVRVGKHWRLVKENEYIEKDSDIRFIYTDEQVKAAFEEGKSAGRERLIDADPLLKWRDRFIQAIKVLCGGAQPPEEIVNAWLISRGDDTRLQEFCAKNALLQDAKGTRIVSSAQVMADRRIEIK